MTSDAPMNGVEEELEMDQSAYEMYHQARTTAPCLSFDIIPDDLGNSRTDFPHTCYAVAGTQAETNAQNSVIVMKLSNLKRTLKEEKDEESDSESESDDEDDQPELESAAIDHNGCVNRIRCTNIANKRLAASWSEIGKVYIWDLTNPLTAVSDNKAMTEYTKNGNKQLPLFQFNGHQAEGYAIDWSINKPGHLATGDNAGNIHVWSMENENKSWIVDQRPFTGHNGSVEDIQWSPNESTVFGSCGVDKSIRIWDTRANPSKANMISCFDAHNSDINVMNWNRNEPFIATGGDDAVIKIWDLRLFQENKPVAILKYHTKPITSIEWNTFDSTVFAASSEDNQLTIWDLAVENDDNQIMDMNNNIEDEEMKLEQEKIKNLPQQLLFVHQGQKEMKELHWHSQIPGVMISTAHTGFNIFKTISV